MFVWNSCSLSETIVRGNGGSYFNCFIGLAPFGRLSFNYADDFLLFLCCLNFFFISHAFVALLQKCTEIMSTLVPTMMMMDIVGKRYTQQVVDSFYHYFPPIRTVVSKLHLGAAFSSVRKRKNGTCAQEAAIFVAVFYTLRGETNARATNGCNKSRSGVKIAFSFRCFSLVGFMCAMCN